MSSLPPNVSHAEDYAGKMTPAHRPNVLAIGSEIIMQRFNAAPLDLLVDTYAVNYPFVYAAEDRIVLAPCLLTATRQVSAPHGLRLATEARKIPGRTG
jgi:hypothetical protein